MKDNLNRFWFVVLMLLLVSSAAADTQIFTTIADFQKGDLQNVNFTLADDGEIIQNYYLEPVSVTINSTALPKELFNHAACKFGDTIVVAGGMDLLDYSKAVYLNTVQSNDLSSWRTGPSLPEGIRDHRIAKLGKYIYCFGGRNGTGISTAIYRAEIDFENKTLGNWQSAGTMPAALEKYALADNLGKFYLIGGSNSSASNKVFMTDVDPDGNLMGWQEVTAMPSGLFDLDAAVYDDCIWTIGGNNGSSEVSTVQAAPINEDGTLGTWQAKTAYPSAVSRHTVLTTSVGLIVFGGTPMSVYTSPIAEAGDIVGWTYFNVSEKVMDHAAVIINSQIFIIGGQNNSGAISKTRKVQLSTYQPWKNSTAIPQIFKCSEGITGIDEYVYMTGGASSSEQNQTHFIYKARILSTGGFTDWTSGGYLPVSLSVHSLCTYNNRIYAVCGYSSGNTNAVWFSNQINSTDGNITSWTWTTPFIAASDKMSGTLCVAYKGYIYASFGSSVYYVKINNDGSLQDWKITSGLPSTVSHINFSAYNDRIYVVLSDNSLFYALINSNGSLNPWVNTFLPLSGFNSRGDSFIIQNSDGNYLTVIDDLGMTVKGKINSDGRIDKWIKLDNGGTRGWSIKGIYFQSAINVFSDVGMPSQYLSPIKYIAQISSATFFGSEKYLQSVSVNADFQENVLSFKYRIFNQQWSPWCSCQWNNVPILINEEAQNLQLTLNITSWNKSTNSIKNISINYSEIAPTPTIGAANSPTPVSLNGQKIKLQILNSQFNPNKNEHADIHWIQAEDAKTSIRIYTLHGELVKNLVDGNDYSGMQEHNIVWTGVNNAGVMTASGIYIVHIQAGQYQNKSKIAIIKK